MSVTTRIRKLLATGLLIVLPALVTILLVAFLFRKIDAFFGRYIESAYFWLVEHINWIELSATLPAAVRVALSLVLTFGFIAVIGLLGTNFAGRRLIRMFETFVLRIPFIKSIYGAAKQLMEALGSPTKEAFSQVVMFEYPRKGVYALGFISGKTPPRLDDQTGQELISIFIPTTPNPTSGFLLLLPREDLIYADMTVEEGIKFIVSGGLVAPQSPRGTAVSPFRLRNGNPKSPAVESAQESES